MNGIRVSARYYVAKKKYLELLDLKSNSAWFIDIDIYKHDTKEFGFQMYVERTKKIVGAY